MKSSPAIVVMISALSITAWVICSPTVDRRPTVTLSNRSTAGIAITSVDFDCLWNFEGRVTEIPLRDLYDPSSVIIADSEVLTYNWSTHTFTVTAAASDRIPRIFAVGTKYFILSVNGEPCYLGAIETRHYSDEHYMPTILVDELPRPGGDQPVSIHLDPCYTFGGSTVSVDIRFNQRLKQYLADTNRLE